MRFQNKSNRYQEERPCIYDIAGENTERVGKTADYSMSGAFYKVDVHGKGSKEKGRERIHGTLES
jgi:hypothetical protein